MGVFTASPSHAVECAPDATTGCVQGVIKTSAGEPAVGIKLTLKGDGDSQSVETDAEGRWAFPVTKAGAYTVSVDKSSLPEGQFFNPQVITKQGLDTVARNYPASVSAGIEALRQLGLSPNWEPPKK